MSASTTAAAAGIAALALVGTGAAATASAQSTPTNVPRYEVAIPDDASTAQREAVAAMLNDTPIPVVDQAGVQRGFVRDSTLTDRDARVNDIILDGFRPYNGGDDQEYDDLYDALRVLDPVPVLDGSGQVAGYFTQHFQTAEQITAATPEAQAMIGKKID